MKKWYAIMLALTFLCANLCAKSDSCLLSQIRTILTNIQNQINGQFVINNVINETFTIVENIESIVEDISVCCASAGSGIEVLESMVESISGCTTIPISAPATITAPGSYCLENNSTDTITISSSDVALNLNNRSLGAVNIGAFSEVTVFNGFVEGGPGITLSGSTNVELAHLQMNNTTVSPSIAIGGASSGVAVYDVIISNPVGDGILLSGGSNNITIKDVLISDAASGSGINFSAAPGAQDVFIESTAVYHCGAHGFHLGDGASIINCVAAYNGGNGMRFQATSSPVSTAAAMYAQDCVVMNNDDDGVRIIGGRITLVNVVAIHNGVDTQSNERRGFFVSNTATIMFEGCIAESNATDGFSIDNSPASTGIIRGCTATNNSGYGFNDPAGGASTIRYINNIASNNGSNNYNVVAGAAPFYSQSYTDIQTGVALVPATVTPSYWTNVAAPNAP